MKTKKIKPLLSIPVIDENLRSGGLIYLNWMIISETKKPTTLLCIKDCLKHFQLSTDELKNRRTFYKKLDLLQKDISNEYGQDYGRIVINLFKKIISITTENIIEFLMENSLPKKINYPFDIIEEEIGLKTIYINENWVWDLIIEESLVILINLNPVELFPYKDSFIYSTQINTPEFNQDSEDDEPHYIVLTDDRKDFWEIKKVFPSFTG
jgi:hypothetical protein